MLLFKLGYLLDSTYPNILWSVYIKFVLQRRTIGRFQCSPRVWIDHECLLCQTVEKLSSKMGLTPVKSKRCSNSTKDLG